MLINQVFKENPTFDWCVAVPILSLLHHLWIIWIQSMFFHEYSTYTNEYSTYTKEYSTSTTDEIILTIS